MLKPLVALIAVSFASSSYAIFCPTSFKSVNYGDSIDAVTATCGAPSSEKNYTKQNVSSEVWTYYVRTQRFNQATSKMKVAFQDGQVVNIHIDDNLLQGANGYSSSVSKNGYSSTVSVGSNGRDVSSTSACGGLISMGYTTQAVQYACGEPANKRQNVQPGPGTSVTELYYSGSTPATLVFENGKLTDRK